MSKCSKLACLIKEGCFVFAALSSIAYVLSAYQPIYPHSSFKQNIRIEIKRVKYKTNFEHLLTKKT